jgi:pimeloyl-ACP methyl ester carboxylesterase
MAQDPETYQALFYLLGGTHDVYFADYRGTGQSATLGSEGCFRTNGQGGVELDARGCAAATRAKLGNRTHHFTVTNTARDIDLVLAATAVRRAGAPTFVFGYSWGTYVANRYLQLVAAGEVPEDRWPAGVVLDAVCAPGPCAGFNIGAQQDMAGRSLLERYCTADARCATELGGDPLHFVETLFRDLGRGELVCASVLHLAQQQLSNVLSGMLSGPDTFNLIPATLKRLRRCSPTDKQALAHLFGAGGNPQRRRSLGETIPTLTPTLTAPVTLRPPPLLPAGASLVHQFNVEYSDMWPGSAAELPTVAELDDAYSSRYLFASGTGATGLSVRPGFETWNRYPRDTYVGGVPNASSRAPWRGGIRVVALNGDVDKAVLHADAISYARRIEGANVRLWTVPHAAHTTVGQSPVIGGGPACGARILASFVLGGRVDGPVDVSCLRSLVGLDFDGVTAKTLANAAKYFNATSLWGEGQALRADL